MNSVTTKIIIRRFIELLLTCAVISSVMTILNLSEAVEGKTCLFMGLLLGTAVFIFVNVIMLRRCYFDLQSKYRYYTANIIAYILFVAVSFAVYFLCSNECYAWIFAITKFARYTNAELSTQHSALLFHGIGLLTVIFAPLGMSWVFMNEDDYDEEYSGEYYDEV